MQLPGWTNRVHHLAVANPRDDLKATEQAILRGAQKIVELEEHKAKLDPSDPDLERISAEVHGVTRSLTAKASAEQELVEEIQAPRKRRQRN